ncbi:hypothetical protein FEM03_13910 [Phragmitibacter flavus]|uniref:Uncharacterized protein n=2 Tax=Phragmitibacter flavus TaxID=2576071 RepID=A0A5R8KD92_9BACT|nr:hypothetical protein FEM03_13910 [Phragmitibacter flavus]
MPQKTQPSEQDFNPHGDDLDARSAWLNFGSLTIEEALLKFRDHPMRYQDDFAFMGSHAFIFYFPVLDTYMRDFQVAEEADAVLPPVIVGSIITSQLDLSASSVLFPLHQNIRSLADYVFTHLRSLATEPRDQEWITSSWQKVYEALERDSAEMF